MAGRPEILTEKLMKEICDCIMIGASVERACSYCGIAKNTYYRWKKFGKEKPDSIYGLFLENIETADSKGVIKLLGDLQKDQSWQSKAWLLERRHNKEFGRKEQLTVKPIPYKDKLKKNENIETDNLSIEECKLINDLYEKNKKIAQTTAIVLDTEKELEEETIEDKKDAEEIDELFDETN